MPNGEAFVRDVPVLRFGRTRRIPANPAPPPRPAIILWAGFVAAAWLVMAVVLYAVHAMATVAGRLLFPA